MFLYGIYVGGLFVSLLVFLILLVIVGDIKSAEVKEYVLGLFLCFVWPISLPVAIIKITSISR